MEIKLRALSALAGLCLAAVPGPAGAATFTVNSTADTTDGACGPGAGECTLREAIEAAVATAGRDTILFDPGVFVLGTLTAINLLTPLPLVADAAGTVVDGSGSSVTINGDQALTDGLVFASAPGVPLANVSVIKLRFGTFPGHGLRICGGVPPACDADVSDALVRNVTAVANGSDGIRIEGRVVSMPQVVDSVALSGGGFGIFLSGSEALLGARVEGCTASDDEFGGIVLDGATNDRASVVDSVAVENAGRGISVGGTDVTKAKLTNVVAHSNGSDGIYVFAEGGASANAIANAMATANVSAGVAIATAFGNTATSLENVEADANQYMGIWLGGPTAGIKIKRAVLIGNADGGISLAEGASKARISDVSAVGNNTGLYLATTKSKVKRILSGGNADVGIWFVPGASGSKLTKSWALGNEFTGVLVSDGVTANALRKNAALGSEDLDLNDLNPGCDANAWTGNVFRTASDPCIH